MEKVIDIIESIANEKGLMINEVKDTVKLSLERTAKRIYGEQYEYETQIDEKRKILQLFQKVLVVSDDDERLNSNSENFINIKEAKEIDPNAEIGDELRYELPLDNLGRTAAATLQKELEYHIQRLLEQQIFEKYKNKIGKCVHGMVTSIDKEENTYIDINEIRCVLPRKNRIKGEKFKVGNVVKSVIRKVFIDKSKRITVELSRTSPRFLEALLELEVPEIKDGTVIVQKSARIPGDRAKLAVASLHPNVDAVGATVGTKGVRINAISKELHNEIIDCIEYSTVPEIFIARALNPAVISNVKIDGKKGRVMLSTEQKSKAIGKNGINIRLASMLTGYEIELIEENSKKAGEAKAVIDPNALKALFGD
ncbi:MAG: transcription termination factor NusA [Campylobacteraceae bacterium]|jgi:N utilization substance protein A|nr:transcription termination factor NusA [Campylobacteraceae bacterium]